MKVFERWCAITFADCDRWRFLLPTMERPTGTSRDFFVCLEEDGEMEGKRRAGVGREKIGGSFFLTAEREEGKGA